MGMLDWLTQTEKKHKEIHSVPYVPPVVETKQLNISEPVQSLLESLKRDEWETKQYYHPLYDCTELHHIYNEDVKLNVRYIKDQVYWGTKSNSWVVTPPVYRYTVSCSWMTEDEKEVINSVLDGVISDIYKRNSDYKNSIEREKFMVLVKG